MRFKNTFIFLMVAVMVLALSAAVQADTLDVCKSGCTYSTISNAIDDVTVANTVIQVTDNSVYNENVVIEGLGITLTGANATINGGGIAAGVSIVNATSGNVVLDGFTITNGAGAGIYVNGSSSSSPSITNCTITSNTDTGIHIYYSANTNISHCTIENNSGSLYGVRIDNSWYPTIENCLIRSNSTSGGGINIRYSGSASLSNCIIDKNLGNAVWVGSSGSAKFINCLFTRNNSGVHIDQYSANSSLINCTVGANKGTPVYYRGLGGGGHKIINSIVWGNEYGIDNHNNLTVTYSDIQGGWEGEGNIEDDPLFSAPEDNDFRLRCASPAKDSGDDSFVYDPDLDGNDRTVGNTIDMGAYEYQSTASCPVPADLYVGDSEVYSKIQDAIDAAKDDDTIWVDKGTYNENIDFKGKDIKVIAEYSEYPGLTTIDGGGSGNVVTFDTYEGLGAQLNGFTIMDGSFGISLANFAMPSISNCIITSNTDNGIYMGYAFGNITDSIISDNTGEGIEASHSNLTVTNSVIEGNSSSGVYVKDYSDYSFFSFCTIENNSGPSGLRIEYSAYSTIENCLIRSNSSGSGGGIYFVGGPYSNHVAPYISSCTIDNNTAYGSGGGGGGGVYIGQGAYAKLINCLITRNETTLGLGSGIHINQYSDHISLINSTVSDNIGGSSSIYYRDLSGGGHKIINSIVWGNETGIDNDSSLTVTYSDIQSGWTGTGNIDLDPDFVNSAAGDYHLNASSSCINAGTTVNVFTDLDGNVRPVGFAYDMGAYEYNEITSDYGIISGYVMDYTNNPISSATVTLREYEAQGNVLATTTSNSDGYYEFNSLSNRVYIIDAEDGSLLNRRTGKTNKSLPWSMEEFINLYLNE